MSKGSLTVYYPCNPAVFGGATTFPVTFEKQKIYIRPVIKPYKPYTLGTQVDELITEWYAAKGLPVPLEEQGLAASIDAVEAEEQVRLDAHQEKANETITEKPEFGTPQFWAWARAQRAEKNKEREKKGLPPLPTAKEKAAKAAERAKAKAEKAAERAKAKAEKAASGTR